MPYNLTLEYKAQNSTKIKKDITKYVLVVNILNMWTWNLGQIPEEDSGISADAYGCSSGHSTPGEKQKQVNS